MEEKEKKRPGARGGVYYEIEDMEVHLFEYPGMYTIRSEEKSNQEISVDDNGIFVGVLQPGKSITHDFKHYVKLEGTNSSKDAIAYVHLDWD